MSADQDPYGEEFGDWESPYAHDDCTGCAMCEPWEGVPYEQILAARAAEVAARRSTMT